jgi:hypothetical protein
MQLAIELTLPFVIAAVGALLFHYTIKNHRKTEEVFLENKADTPSFEFLEFQLRKSVIAIAATELAVFDFQPSSGILAPLYHIRSGNSDQETRKAALAAFTQIILPCVQQSKDGVIEIPNSQSSYGTQFCLVTLTRHQKQVRGAAAFIIRRQNMAQARQALTQLQIGN